MIKLDTSKLLGLRIAGGQGGAKAGSKPIAPTSAKPAAVIGAKAGSKPARG